MYSTSGIRVMMSYDSRTTGTPPSCCRYYIKFNGNECTTPGSIEGATYSNRDVNLHVSGISKSGNWIVIFKETMKPSNGLPQ